MCCGDGVCVVVIVCVLKCMCCGDGVCVVVMVCVVMMVHVLW